MDSFPLAFVPVEALERGEVPFLEAFNSKKH